MEGFENEIDSCRRSRTGSLRSVDGCVCPGVLHILADERRVPFVGDGLGLVKPRECVVHWHRCRRLHRPSPVVPRDWSDAQRDGLRKIGAGFRRLRFVQPAGCCAGEASNETRQQLTTGARLRETFMPNGGIEDRGLRDNLPIAGADSSRFRIFAQPSAQHVCPFPEPLIHRARVDAGHSSFCEC